MADEPQPSDRNLSRPGLTGQAETVAGTVMRGGSKEGWATRTHKQYGKWLRAERKQRASYIASRSVLKEFLVPHQFEGEQEGKELNRAGLGFGVGLNAMWVLEIMGHLRHTSATRIWGPLGDGEEEETAGAPSGGPAQRLWEDATLSNTTWANFWNRRVLEWMLTSVGGFVVVDSQEAPDTGRRRPVFRWFPWSSVEDYSCGKYGFRQLKFSELHDERDITAEDDEGLTSRHLIYELDEDSGTTTAYRVDDDGEDVGDRAEIGELVDFQGQPTLPVVPVKWGDHPLIRKVGQGLLMGLDDIVIDLYNLHSEAREGFRDAAFSAIWYKGPGEDEVHNSIKKGSRYWPLGDDPNAEVGRIAGDPTEATAGAELWQLGIKAWGLSAKRRSAEASENLGEEPSGEAIKAEFALDQRPILTLAAENLDEAESLGMLLAAQMQDEGFDATTEDARRIGVTRSTEFQVEEEGSRIVRLVNQLSTAFGTRAITPEAGHRLLMRFYEETDLLNLEEETEDGRPLKEVLDEEIANFFEERRAAGAQAAQGRLPVGDGGLQLR